MGGSGFDDGTPMFEREPFILLSFLCHAVIDSVLRCSIILPDRSPKKKTRVNAAAAIKGLMLTSVTPARFECANKNGPNVRNRKRYLRFSHNVAGVSNMQDGREPKYALQRKYV
jgi:hypothetical protein